MVELSVISVVKNEEKFIEEMVGSVVNSLPSFINLELIIIDDHSSDHTRHICEQLSAVYDFISVYENENFGKVAGTLQGLRYASKHWVKCIDGDDFVDFAKLNIDNFNCDAFYHDYYRYASGEIVKYVKTSPSLAKSKHQWNYNLRSIPKGMFFFKRCLFKNEDFQQLLRFSYEDAFINFIIIKNANVVRKLNHALYYYRQHDNNFYGDVAKSSEKIKRMRSRLHQNYDLFTELYPNYPISRKLPTYIDALEHLSFLSFVRLVSEPQLLMKALVYRVRSKL